MLCILVIHVAQLSMINSYSVHVRLPEINKTTTDKFEHLKYRQIKAICENRDVVCKGRDTNVCSMRFFNGSIEYKDFTNTCYMFLTNMCDVPGDVTSILRNRAESTFSTLYNIDTAFDFHICPYSCPDTYSPVCVSANRGYGKYFKFFTFVNHCSGDLYYCKNWQEFAPPEDEDERVNISPLSWSFCGASRYLQFARFAEVSSSMGHYGWLSGDYRYSHIMEPHQRMPGYG